MIVILKSGGRCYHNDVYTFSSVQLLSHVWLFDLMDCSTPGFPVHHHLPELSQSHVHQVGDAIQPSHPLLSPSPPNFNLSWHQGWYKLDIITCKFVRDHSAASYWRGTSRNLILGVDSERLLSVFLLGEKCALITHQPPTLQGALTLQPVLQQSASHILVRH